MTQLSVVIPTLGRPGKLARVLDRLGTQDAPAGSFDVIVVADAASDDVGAVDAVVAGGDRARGFPVRRLSGARPGASSARNTGWRSAAAPLVLFLDDDVLPDPGLVREHLDWHERHPEPSVGVLGDVRWADGLRVTPFMRWLEDGIQFAYRHIDGVEAGWGRFYTANASVKRALLERVGGFDEERLPFGYEDLDLALRMSEHQFRLLYNRAASAEHDHPMSVAMWQRRVERIARSERTFTRLHPEVEPYFHRLFSTAHLRPAMRGRGARIARWVPRGTPWLGARVWEAADVYWRQQLAPPFLAAWDAAGKTSHTPAEP